MSALRLGLFLLGCGVLIRSVGDLLGMGELEKLAVYTAVVVLFWNHFDE